MLRRHWRRWEEKSRAMKESREMWWGHHGYQLWFLISNWELEESRNEELETELRTCFVLLLWVRDTRTCSYAEEKKLLEREVCEGREKWVSEGAAPCKGGGQNPVQGEGLAFPREREGLKCFSWEVGDNIPVKHARNCRVLLNTLLRFQIMRLK